MTNVMSVMSGLDNESKHLPYLIWWLLWPQCQYALFSVSTLSTDARADYHHCYDIYGYRDIYAKADVEPSWRLCQVAKKSPNNYYAKDLLKRAAELDINITEQRQDYEGSWEYLEDDLEPTEDVLCSEIHADSVYRDSHRLFPSGRALSGIVDGHVWVSPELLSKVEIEGGHWYGDTEHLEGIDEETLRKER